VTITGTNFTDAAAVTIGSAPATHVIVVNSKTITAVTPPGAAGTTRIVVTTFSSTAVHSVTAFKRYTYE
jgi:hypothetical protein